MRGAGGGYSFCGNARRLTLLDVIKLFEQVGRDAEDSPPMDQVEGRALHNVLREIDDTAISALRATSIATLVKVIEKRRREAGEEGKASRPAAGGA